jgi:hypothetical protein
MSAESARRADTVVLRRGELQLEIGLRPFVMMERVEFSEL